MRIKAEVDTRTLHYQIHAVLLQSFWIIGLLALLRRAALARERSFLTLLAASLSGNRDRERRLMSGLSLMPVGYLFGVVAIVLAGAKAGQDLVLCGRRAAGARWPHWRRPVARRLPCLCALARLRALFTVLHWVIPSRGFLLGSFMASFVLADHSMEHLSARYVDPPGNRLLKWHLAGVVPIDQRGVGETLWQSYRDLSPGQVVQNKQANFGVLIHGFSGIGALPCCETTVGLGTTDDYLIVRMGQFYVLSANVAWMLPGLLLLGFKLLRGSRPTIWHRRGKCSLFPCGHASRVVHANVRSRRDRPEARQFASTVIARRCRYDWLFQHFASLGMAGVLPQRGRVLERIYVVHSLQAFGDSLGQASSFRPRFQIGGRRRRAPCGRQFLVRVQNGMGSDRPSPANFPQLTRFSGNWQRLNPTHEADVPILTSYGHGADKVGALSAMP